MARITNEAGVTAGEQPRMTPVPADNIPTLNEPQDLDQIKSGVQDYNTQAQKDLMETQEALQKEVEDHVAAGEPESDRRDTAGDGESESKPFFEQPYGIVGGVTVSRGPTEAEPVAANLSSEAETATADAEYDSDDHVSGDGAGTAEDSGSDAPEVLVGSRTESDSLVVKAAPNHEPATSGFVQADDSLKEDREAVVVKEMANLQKDIDANERPIPTEDEQREANRKAFETLKTLPYIDLYNQLQDAQKNVRELMQLHDAVGAYSDKSAASMLALLDKAEREKWQGSVKDFSTNYRATYVDGRRLVKLITAMIQSYDGSKISSTAFISKSMVESAQLRRDAVATREMKEGVADNKAVLLRRIDNTLVAYSDRIHYPMLINKLHYPANILDCWKTFFKTGPEEALKVVDKTFSNQFNDVRMHRWRNAVQNMITLHESEDFDKKISKDRLGVIIFFMLYWLATVYEKEFESGKCAEVKTLIMAIYDCDVNSRIYDLPGGPELVSSFVYLLFTLFLVITSGTYSAKQLHKEVNRMLNDLLRVYNEEEQAQIAKFPGTVYTASTNYVESVGGTFEDLDTMIDYNEKIPGDVESIGPVYVLIDDLPKDDDVAPNTVYLKKVDGGYEQWTYDELGWSKDETLLDEDEANLRLYGESTEVSDEDAVQLSDFKYAVVSELPAEEDVDIRTIYLMKDPENPDKFEQWVWQQGWTEIGDEPLTEAEGMALSGDFGYMLDKKGDVESVDEDETVVTVATEPTTETPVAEDTVPQTSADPEPEETAEPEIASEESVAETSPEGPFETPAHPQYVVEDVGPHQTTVAEGLDKEHFTICCVVDNEDPWDPMKPGYSECVYYIANADGRYTPMVYVNGKWQVNGADVDKEFVKGFRHIDYDWPMEATTKPKLVRTAPDLPASVNAPTTKKPVF